MNQGGGTLVLASYGRYRGPGHCSVLLDEDERDWLVHHCYDAEDEGIPRLQIRPLLWADDGWPLAGEPDQSPLASEGATADALLQGAWEHSVNFERRRSGSSRMGTSIGPTIQPGGPWRVAAESGPNAISEVVHVPYRPPDPLPHPIHVQDQPGPQRIARL